MVLDLILRQTDVQQRNADTISTRSAFLFSANTFLCGFVFTSSHEMSNCLVGAFGALEFIILAACLLILIPRSYSQAPKPSELLNDIKEDVAAAIIKRNVASALVKCYDKYAVAHECRGKILKIAFSLTLVCLAILMIVYFCDRT